MENWQAILLGLVEGITEFLPISSTGHLILTQRAFGLPDNEAARAFAICIQAGAIVAVLGVFLPRVRSMARGLIGRDALGRRMLVHLLVAFLPAAVCGLLFEKKIEASLFGLWPVVCAWLAGGLAILLVPRLRLGRSMTAGLALEALTTRHALIIGCFQCLALLPGTSRSLATIAGALMLGFSSAAAVEFSLLLGVLTLSAAAGYKALKSGAVLLDAYGSVTIALGFLAALISAFLAVKWLIAWLGARGLAVFGWYRVALALTVAFCLWRGVLQAH